MRTEFAPIAPLSVYRKLKRKPEVMGKYHLLLAHEVLKDPNGFADIFAREDMFVIMDNSVIELGYALEPQQLIDACEAVDADVLILPDVLHNKVATMSRSLEGFDTIHAKMGTALEYMIVPQGTTFHEIISCTYELHREIKPEWIGIPRWIANTLGSRTTLVHELTPLGTQIHLLGFSDNWVDDIVSARLPSVKGIDSSVPVLLGAYAMPFVLTADVRKRPDREPMWSSEPELSYGMEHNIRKVQAWLNRTTTP